MREPAIISGWKSLLGAMAGTIFVSPVLAYGWGLVCLRLEWTSQFVIMLGTSAAFALGALIGAVLLRRLWGTG